MLRVRGRFGHPYTYRPKGNLLARLATKNAMTIEAVYTQLQAERRAMLADLGVFL